MNDISVLIAGKAGFGIDTSGLIIAKVFNKFGYRIYIYRDYPSLIRGGHTFSIIRASPENLAAHKDKVDFLLALNQDALDLHIDKIKQNTVVLYDSDSVRPKDVDTGLRLTGVPLSSIVKQEGAPEIMRNTCLIGCLFKLLGVGWETLEDVLRKNISKEIELNLKVAQRGFDEVKEVIKLDPLGQKPLAVITGNESIALGLIRAGLKTYVAYPMTPSSSILHFLASLSDEFSLKVLHPESEIAVALMALGAAYAGEKAAVGTSGGGFCLMTETLSFAGMSELPIVIFVGQRPGPSTGLPTYTSQADLHFILHAGQGEFPRFVVAPGDPEEAYYFSALALNMAWKYQIPAIILSDKTLSEGTYNFDLGAVRDIEEEKPFLWDRKGAFKRYAFSENGVSGLAFPSDKEAVVKINSYEHDEAGITCENAAITKDMQDKRLRKKKSLALDLEKIDTVKAYGKMDSATAIICWGSNKGVCIEAARSSGLKLIMPVVLEPFPLKQLDKALSGVKRLVCVENNATGQLSRLLKTYGYKVDAEILKYDGRPFSVDELQERLKGILK